MSFDKKEYWELRRAGKRGQGDYSRPIIVLKGSDERFKNGSHLVQMGNTLMNVNRITARAGKKTGHVGSHKQRSRRSK